MIAEQVEEAMLGKRTVLDTASGERDADRWKGTFTIATNAPTGERIARVNPLGLYVVSANWSRVLQ